MSSNVISVTDASRSFFNILDKVYTQGESYEIKRGRQVIAKIVPATSKRAVLKVNALNELFTHLAKLEENDQQAFE